MSDQQTNEQKARRHLERAEKRNAFIDRLEDDARQKVARIYGPELTAAEPGARERILAYRMKKELEGDELYKQRGATRNYHIAMATAYGIMALLDRMDQPEPTS